MRQYLRFRYSIKTLLLAVFVFSVALTSALLLTESAREQANAVQELQRLGATVYYDFQRYYDKTIEDHYNGEIDGWCISDARKPLDWKWARRLLGDDVFSNIYMIQFVRYHHYSPPHTFGPAPRPTELSLNADKHIHLLEGVPNITQLDLSYSHVSDEAILTLGKLKTLRGLLLQDSQVTQEGVERLRKLLPGCNIYWVPGKPVEEIPASETGSRGG